jgi:thiol-disulfide isomerase/thioredoxin
MVILHSTVNRRETFVADQPGFVLLPQRLRTADRGTMLTPANFIPLRVVNVTFFAWLAGTGGKAVHVASVNKESWVLLNFWGSWCSGCLLEMPDVKQIAHDHADKLIVLGITVTDKEEAVQRFLKRSPLPYPVVYGPSWKSDLLQTYGVSNAHGYHAPVSVLIRPGGKVVYVQDGASEKHPFLSEEINAALRQAR